MNFESGYRGIIWILTRRFLSKDIVMVSNSLKDLKSEIKGLKLNYFGCGFGKYDLAIEIEHESPRVISGLINQLRENLEKKLGSKNNNNFCPSLTLSKKLGGRLKERGPIRAYTFYSISHPNAEKFLDLIKKYKEMNEIELCWNTSTYSFIFTIGGKKYSDVWEKILRLRKYIIESDKEILIDVRTFFLLEWDDNKKDLAKDEAGNEDIPATIYIKSQSYRITCHFDIFEMPGYYDKFIRVNANSLYDIQKIVHNLREENKDIENTATYPLYKNERGE